MCDVLLYQKSGQTVLIYSDTKSRMQGEKCISPDFPYFKIDTSQRDLHNIFCLSVSL